MPSTPEEKKKVLTRVRRIRGQIDALERALENGAECRSILQQIAAVRGAANGLMAEVLESHIRKPLTRMTATAMKSVNPLTIRLNWFAPILNS
jgi:DNA-binding FrmR family transcriptional regulator